MVTALGPMLVDDPNDEAFVEANEAVEADGESKFKPFGFFSGVPDNEFKKIDWNPLVPEVNNGDFWKNNVLICKLADLGFFKYFLYQGGVKSTVSWIFEDLKFKISEGYDQYWRFPV